MNDFLLILLSSVAGSFTGALTGLIPGLHTNNVAILLFALVSSSSFSIYICIFIVAAAISHTFLDIIPSTFIGAPEEDTALVVLPAHSMVLQGRGYEAIYISALSSLTSIAFCFALLLPFRFLIGEPFNLYKLIEQNMLWILICIVLIVIFTNDSIWKAITIFLLSGFFGVAALNLHTSFLFQSSPIFPALAGLFGAPALLYSKHKVLPEQNVVKGVNIEKKEVGNGVVAGSIVSILPGVSSAIAATLAIAVKKKRKEEEVVALLSATNTANNFFVLAMLFIMLKARSGFAVVMKKFIEVEQWNSLLFPYPYNLFLIAVIISSIISYYLTKYIGKMVAMNISKISYSLLIKIAFGIIIIMVFLFTGFLGLLIFGTASLIGIICLEMKVRRSVCMGFLLLPLILGYI